MLEQDRLLPLLNDDRLLERVKLEDYLLVFAGLRGAGLVTIPGELPEGTQVLQNLDGIYSHKYFQGVNPASGAVSGIVDRLKYGVLRMTMTPLQYKAMLIRETFNELLAETPSYKSHRGWARRLGLDSYELEVRPSMKELFIYREEDLPRVQQLAQAMRDVREGRIEPDLQATQPTAVIFPEQHSSQYVSALGQLLGYPPCCIERFIADRRAGVVPEMRGAEQLEHFEAEGDAVPADAYFARDFVPCRPDCAAARSMGQKAIDALGEIDHTRLVARYEGVLRANRDHIKDYPRLMQRHAERLRGELRDIRRRESDDDGRQ